MRHLASAEVPSIETYSLQPKALNPEPYAEPLPCILLEYVRLSERLSSETQVHSSLQTLSEILFGRNFLRETLQALSSDVLARLLKGPRRGRFLMSDVPRYPSFGRPP